MEDINYLQLIIILVIHQDQVIILHKFILNILKHGLILMIQLLQFLINQNQI